MRESFDYWLQIECPLCGSNKTYAHEDGDGQIDIIMCAACHRETNRRPEDGGGGWIDVGLTTPAVANTIEMVAEKGLSSDPYRGRESYKEASSPINVVEVDDRTTEYGAVYGRRPLIYMPETMALYVGQEGFHHQDVINGMPRLTADGTPIEDADHAIAEGELHDMGNNEAVFHVGGFGGVRGYEPSLQEVEALRTALSDLTGMDVDTHEGWRARTGSVKTGMAMNPNGWARFVSQHPYLTHYTEDRNLAGILRHGILPADDPRADFSEYEGDWFSTRPGHVYLNTGNRDTSMFDTYREFPLIPVQVDTSKLDPANIVSDEDAIGAWSDHDDEQLGMTHPSMPWAMSELRRRRDGDSPEAPEFDSLGQWAEDNANVLDDPKVVPQAIDMTDTLAHKGPIPPEAVSIHPDYVDSYPDQAIGEAYPPEPLPGQEQLWDVGGPVRTQFDPSIEDRRDQLRSQANTIFTCPECGSINGLESEGVDYCIDCQAAYSSDGKTPLTPEEVDDIQLLKRERDAGPPRPTSSSKVAMPLSPDSPGLPEFFYHVSPQENRDKILQEGLLPNAPSAWKEHRDVYEGENVPKTPDGVYLYDHLGNARAYASKMSGNGLPANMAPMSEVGWDIYEIPASEVQGAVIDPEMSQQQGWNYNYDMAMDIVKGQWDHLGPEMPVVQGHRYYTENAIPPEALRIVESMPLVGPEEHEQYKREMQYVPTTLTMVPDLTNSPLADPEWNWDKHGSNYDKDGFKVEKVGTNKGVWAYTKPQPEVKGHNSNPKLEGKTSSEFDPAIWGEEQRQDVNQHHLIDCPYCGQYQEDRDWKMNQSYNEEVGDYYRCPSCATFISWHELMDHRRGDTHTAANQFDPTIWGEEPERRDPSQLAFGGMCPECGGYLQLQRAERGSDYVPTAFDEYSVRCVGGDDPGEEWADDGCGYETGWYGTNDEQRRREEKVEGDALHASGHPPLDYDDALDDLLVDNPGYNHGRFRSEDADSIVNIAKARGEMPQLKRAFDHWRENFAWPAINEIEELNWEYLQPSREYHEEFFDEDEEIDWDAWYDSNDYKWTYDDIMSDFGPHEALKHLSSLFYNDQGQPLPL